MKCAAETPEFKELMKELRQYGKEYDTVTFMGDSFGEGEGVGIRVLFTNREDMVAQFTAKGIEI